MTSRERILAAICHQPVDRIPLDIWATGEVWAMLAAHFGDHACARAALHLDSMGSVGAAYTGPALPTCTAGEGVNIWGVRTQPVSYETGTYQEVSFSPLAAAVTIDDLNDYTWPSADWFDYSAMRAQAEAQHDERVVQCGYMAPFYFHNMLRGFEQSLMDPLIDPEFTHCLVGRISDFFYEHHRRMFEACAELIDIAQVTDDLGSQSGPLISLETYREFYAPHHRRFAALCHEFGIHVFHHDDGAIRPFLPDLIDLGIDILNPIQWVCPGMELTGLKRDFGAQICFHGGIENQQVLPFGSEQDVRAEVRHCIDGLAADGTGYILASSHNIQANTPLANIIAMYDEAWHYGRISGV